MYVGIKLYESAFNILVQNPMAATPDTSPENKLTGDHRHSTNGSTELRVSESTEDDNKIAAVTCSPSETIHRSTETGWFIQLFLYVVILFLQYIFNYVASLFAYILLAVLHYCIPARAGWLCNSTIVALCCIS